MRLNQFKTKFISLSLSPEEPLVANFDEEQGSEGRGERPAGQLLGLSLSQEARCWLLRSAQHTVAGKESCENLYRPLAGDRPRTRTFKTPDEK